MELSQLKLALIQEILQCDNPQVLKGLQQFLAANSAVRSATTDAPPWEAIQATTATTSEEVADLQQSIDDIFGDE